MKNFQTQLITIGFSQKYRVKIFNSILSLTDVIFSQNFRLTFTFKVAQTYYSFYERDKLPPALLDLLFVLRLSADQRLGNGIVTLFTKEPLTYINLLVTFI